MCTTNKNKPKKKYTHPPMEDSSKLEDFEYLEYSKHLIDYKGNIGYSNEGFPVDVIGINFGNGENMFVPANNYEIEIRFHTSGPESTLTIRAVNLSTGECKMATHSHTDYEALREQIYPFKSQDSRGQRNNYSSPHYNRFEPHDRLLDSQFWDLELSSYGEPRVFSSGGGDYLQNISDGVNGGGFAATGLTYKTGNALSRTLAYTNTGTLYTAAKANQVMFKLPVGNVYLPTKLVGGAAKTFKVLGTSAGIVGGAFIAGDVLYNSEIRASHGINAFMTGIAFSGYGAPVAAVWFVADIGTSWITGTSISERIDANTSKIDWDW